MKCSVFWRLLSGSWMWIAGIHSKESDCETIAQQRRSCSTSALRLQHKNSQAEHSMLGCPCPCSQVCTGDQPSFRSVANIDLLCAIVLWGSIRGMRCYLETMLGRQQVNRGALTSRNRTGSATVLCLLPTRYVRAREAHAHAHRQH